MFKIPSILSCKVCNLEVLTDDDGVVELSSTEFEWNCPDELCSAYNIHQFTSFED